MGKYLALSTFVFLVIGYFLGVFFPGPGSTLRSKIGV